MIKNIENDATRKSEIYATMVVIQSLCGILEKHIQKRLISTTCIFVKTKNYENNSKIYFIIGFDVSFYSKISEDNSTRFIT